MSQNQYTQKSMEAIQRAQTLAGEHANQTLEQAHLLTSLLEAPEGLIPQLITRMGMDAGSLRQNALVEVERLPKVRGSVREEGKTYVSQEMDRALREAANAASRMKDEYISVEHLFLGLLQAPDRGIKTLFERFGIKEADFLQALSQVRGAARVTSDNPEDSYDALSKYGSDLTDLAWQSWTLSSGRDSEIRDVIRILSRKTKSKQPGPDRRARCWQSRHRGGPGPAHCAGRCTGQPEGPQHLLPGHGGPDRGRQIPG